MTVIAYCGKYLAADKKANLNGIGFTTTKLYVLDKYSAVAVTGKADMTLALVEWFKRGRHASTYPQINMEENPVSAVYVENGKLFIYESSGHPIPVEDDYFAHGCGQHFALGALHKGADAIEAVEIASELSDGCGRGIDYYEIKIKKPTKKKKAKKKR